MYWNLTDRKRLLKALELAKKADILEEFLVELLSETELKTFERKLEAVCMLKDVTPYKIISQKTKLSPKTIVKLQETMRDFDSALQEVMRKFLEKGKPYEE